MSQIKDKGPAIRVGKLDKSDKRPHSSYQHRKFSKSDLNLIGKKGREELKKILHDVHGDKPVFEFPVLSFDRENERLNVSIDQLNSQYKTVGKKLWKYISKDILDKYKPVEKVYAINLCYSRRKYLANEKKILSKFTYGKYVQENQGANHIHHKKKSKGRRKLNPKGIRDLGSGNRRNSRRGSINLKFMEGSNYRRDSSSGSARAYRLSKDFGNSKAGEKDFSSDNNSDFSKDHSRTAEEVFPKSHQNPNDEEQSVVQELDDEDNISDQLSQKKLSRRKSLRKIGFKLKRRNSFKKQASPISRDTLLRSKEDTGSLIKLQRTTLDEKMKLKKNSPSKASISKVGNRKTKLFSNLHDIRYLSSLGHKQKIPELPKSVFPKSRLNSLKKRERPLTAAHSGHRRCHSRATNKSKSPLKIQKSIKSDYWDGYPTHHKKSRQSNSAFDKRSSSMKKRLHEIEKTMLG
ncbi:unnamed protein product [Moneuplotes crassus]|uniref:Uncharacterized protein n=2 Tax=Euplotes crassus TaxID=5936 RepID=A0AAD1XDM0_EUPCR|nr:unnamed protein product [Moneuplotes crassus]